MRLLSFDELRTTKGVTYSRAQIHRKVKDRSFPAPIKVGDNRNAWIEEEIDAYIETKRAERDAKLEVA